MFTDLDSIFIGTDNLFKFEPSENSSVQNITGWTLVFNIKTTASRNTASLITKTIGSGITVTDALSGFFEVLLNAADTDVLLEQQYYWEVSRNDIGNKYVLGYGIFTAKEHVVDLV